MPGNPLEIQQSLEGMIQDLGPLGLKPPRFLKTMLEENEIYSHAVWKNIYEGKNVNFHQMEVPDREERQWFSEKYPLFDPLYKSFWEAAEQGEELTLPTTFLHCKVCQFPLLFVDAENKPTMRWKTHGARKHYFCSEPCEWVFDLEPDKYSAVLTQDEIFAGDMVKPDELTKFWGVDRALNGDIERK